MSRAEPPVHGPGLPVDVASLVAGEEEGDASNLVSLPAALEWIQLADLALRAAGARRLERGRRHARLNQAWAYGVDPDPRARQLVRARLRHRHHRGFRGRVRRGPRVRAQARDGRGADDAAA